MIELPSPCLVVLVGPAGSGKSTWAQATLPAQIVSADRLRALVGEGEDDLRASTDALTLLDDVVARRLARGLTTVVDTLGSDAARRARWRELAAAAGIPAVAVLFEPPAAQVRRQNKARDKRVPGAVLRTQLAEWPAVRAAVEAEPFAAVHVADTTPRASTAPTATLVAAALASATTPTGPVAADRPVRFGLHIPRYAVLGPSDQLGARLRTIAAHAEAVGFDSIWVMDHFRQIPQVGPAWEDMLESWTTLAHLAAVTDRVRLGTLVSGITHRNVAQLGKLTATLDVLSGGRAVCGLGLGWFEAEHRAYGLPFGTPTERYALLEDALQFLPHFWGPGNKPYTGSVLHVPDTTCYPRPLQAHIPILVGGSGERRTLRLVARFADAANLFGEPDVVAQKVEVLHRHCAAVGRDPADVSVTHLGTVLVGEDAAEVTGLVEGHRPPRTSAERFARQVHAGTIDQHVTRVRNYVAAGVDTVIVSLVDLGERALDRAGQVIAACT